MLNRVSLVLQIQNLFKNLLKDISNPMDESEKESILDMYYLNYMHIIQTEEPRLNAFSDEDLLYILSLQEKWMKEGSFNSKEAGDWNSFCKAFLSLPIILAQFFTNVKNVEQLSLQSKHS